MERVLVVDDEEGIRTFVAEVLEGQGLQVTMAASGQEAVRLIDGHSFHLIVTDLRMPLLDGISLIRKVRTEQPETEVIVLTAHGTVATAVEAMRLGAYDYLTKPLSGPDELRLVAGRALERRRLREARQRERPADDQADAMVVSDPSMVDVIDQVQRVATTDAPVLLLGESGTGKEVLARRIHRLSRRPEGPFVAVNCAALPESLLESEMFGHEKGSFTGATGTHRGRFELADGGTLFLDEIAELQPRLQAKLLRVLQDLRFQRVGGNRTIEVDVRIVSATNHDLESELESGRFRSDLYHRLAVFPISLPPLRNRPGDIQPLATHLLGQIGRQLGRPTLSLDADASRRLLSYDWPGNVRELANVLERAAILSSSTVLTAEHLALDVKPGRLDAGTTIPFDGTLDDIKREAIRRALAACGGNRKNAAARLGIGLRTLYDKLRAYRIE